MEFTIIAGPARPGTGTSLESPTISSPPWTAIEARCGSTLPSISRARCGRGKNDEVKPTLDRTLRDERGLGYHKCPPVSAASRIYDSPSGSGATSTGRTRAHPVGKNLRIARMLPSIRSPTDPVNDSPTRSRARWLLSGIRTNDATWRSYTPRQQI